MLTCAEYARKALHLVSGSSTFLCYCTCAFYTFFVRVNRWFSQATQLRLQQPPMRRTDRQTDIDPARKKKMYDIDGAKGDSIPF